MMKTKLTSVTYLGFTAMDRRFSNAMLPWLLREMRATNTRDKLSITVEDGYLKAYNGNFEPVIVHRLVDIIRASQVPGRPEDLFYILLNEKENLLNCYMFRAATVDESFAGRHFSNPGYILKDAANGVSAYRLQYEVQPPSTMWSADGMWTSEEMKNESGNTFA